MLRKLAIITLALYGAGAMAQGDLGAQLGRQYVGKMVTLSAPAEGEMLIFAADGSVTRGKPAASSIFGHVVVRELAVNPDRVSITGDRVFLIYDPVEKRFRDYLELLNDDKWRQSLGVPAISKGDRKWFEKRREVRIEVATAGSEPQGALEKVIQLTDDLHYPKPAPQPPEIEVANSKGVHKVGQKISAPRIVSAPEPRYNDYARKARLQGTSVLWVVIGSDGRVKDIKVQRPIGMGLDENALETVRTWRFKPSERDGQPVAVQVNVEVNFRLY
jgi:TonB family protein